MDMNDSRWKVKLHLAKGNLWARVEEHEVYQMYKVAVGRMSEVDSKAKIINTDKYALYRDREEAMSALNTLVGMIATIYMLTEPDPKYPDKPLFDLSCILWGMGGIA